MKQLDQYIEQIEKELKSQKGIQVETREIGYVTEVKDGVVTLRSIGEKGSHTHALIDLLLDPPQNI